MEIKVIFADTHEVYLKKLMCYIEKHFKGVYQISVCYQKKQLREMLKLEKYDVLCLTPEMYDKSIDLKQVLVPIMLEDETISELDQFKHVINKYTRISKLMQYIDTAYRIAQENKPIIYGVYGPAGGTGTSTIAIALTLSYVQVGKKVCYLNLEDINSTELFFKACNCKALMGEEDLESTPYMCKDNIHNVIYCSDVKKALAQTNQSITTFMETLLEQEVATVIVVDLGSHLSEVHHEVIKQVDKLFITMTKTDYAAYKVEKFINKCRDLEKVAVVMNESKTIDSNKLPVPVVGCVDKLCIEQAVNICEYIAQNHLIEAIGI